VDRSRSFVRAQLDSRSSQIGSTISSTARELRHIAVYMRSGEPSAAGAELAERSADALERVGHYLQEAGGDRLFADVETFSRERPWAVAAAALASGFAASRVLRASRSHRRPNRDNGGTRRDAP
jgi:hypothetical protein